MKKNEFVMTKEEQQKREAEAAELLEENDIEKTNEEEDLAFYFLAYDDLGGELRRIYDMTEADAVEFLRNPQDFQEKYELTDDDFEELEDFMEAVKKERELKIDMFRELKDKNKENPIFDESRECPEGMVPIYHYTGESALEKIGTGGLKTLDKIWDEKGKNKNEFEGRFAPDRILDEKAPEGFSRTNSVYAYPEFRGRNGMESGNVILELYVHPDKVLVCDADLYNSVSSKVLQKSADADEYAEAYWKKSMTLREFMDLSEEEKTSFSMPEVLIPGGIDQGSIKARGITFLT